MARTPLRLDQIRLNIERNIFTGVFDLSEGGNNYYDDYTSEIVLPTLSINSNPQKGAIATVRVIGGSLNPQFWPSTWNDGDSPVTTNTSEFNEITILFVSNNDIRIVNRIVSVPDFVAPEFVGTPSATNVQETSFDITATLNENGTVYGYLLANGSTAPTLQEIIDNAQDSFIDSGSGGTLSFTGLVAETDYDVYLVAEDELGNRQAASTLVEVLTGGGISAEAQAVINRMTTPSTVEENAIANFVDTLVASGDWGLIDEFQFNQMDSEINSLVGWKGVANATNNNATWGKPTGFVLDGSTAWINSNFNPATQSTNYLLNSGLLGVGIVNKRNNTVTTNLIGSRDVDVNSILIADLLGTNGKVDIRLQSNSTSQTSNNYTFPVGNILFTRNLSSQASIILNGIEVSNIASTRNTEIPNNPISIGAFNNNGSISGHYDADFGYFIIGGIGINITNLNNAINQLKTDLGL